MKDLFENTKNDDARAGFSSAQETKRSCSLGLEFLLKKGTPKCISDDGTPCFPGKQDLSVFLIDYAGNEDDILPSKDADKWFDKQLNHMLPRCSDLDRLVLLFHCKNFPIASTVPCMLNGGAGVNEFSGRYAELPDVCVSEDTLTNMFGASASANHKLISSFYGDRYNEYRELIDSGVSRELSRGILPAGQYTEFFTRLTLFNLIKFIEFYDNEDDALMKPVIEQMKVVFQLGFPKLYTLFKKSQLSSQEKLWEKFLKTGSNAKNKTYRRNSPKLEESWGKKHIVQNENGTPLDGDKCWVKVIDYSGTDKTPHDAVGMSMGNLTSPTSIDSLVNLLISLGHCSPFELTTLYFESHVPFFVFRHIIRHRSMGIYDWKFLDEVFVPGIRPEEGKTLAPDAHAKLKAYTEAAYKKSLDARASIKHDSHEADVQYMISPVSQYVSFLGRIDIHNLVHILNLRKHPAAQFETRMLAHTLQKILADWVPVVYNAFISNNKLDALPGKYSEAA
ncbi:MAG: FAD-dependent thymidylate synthase [Holosporales bacterium]|jgi:thymidylate synthase ThyX|nr:FAD-dependent thymidylate synthase [Holosporales bacterium]